MILHINSNEYDYHTLVKVAEMAGLAGLVGFHESEDGYIVSFPDTENTQALINVSGGRKSPLFIKDKVAGEFFLQQLSSYRKPQAMLVEE